MGKARRIGGNFEEDFPMLSKINSVKIIPVLYRSYPITIIVHITLPFQLILVIFGSPGDMMHGSDTHFSARYSSQFEINHVPEIGCRLITCDIILFADERQPQYLLQQFSGCFRMSRQ
ncbi:hypothetical protein D3C73_1397330 [compost metagenome]